MPHKISVARILLALLCVAGLTVTFIFQRFDIAAYFNVADVAIHKFIINRTVRFFLNDIFAIGLIYALFPVKKYVIFSVYVQLIGIVLFLIPYFILKIYWPSYNGPLINFLHRLILNPILLLLLIPAFYYQQRMINAGTKN